METKKGKRSFYSDQKKMFRLLNKNDRDKDKVISFLSTQKVGLAVICASRKRNEEKFDLLVILFKCKITITLTIKRAKKLAFVVSL
jgi:hypothetical protein